MNGNPSCISQLMDRLMLNVGKYKEKDIQNDDS